MKQINKIEIQNSEFFIEDFKLDFSTALNCIMGSRGTGKSTLLHFIKSCIELNSEENKDTYEILKNNLGGGLVKLYVKAENGEIYRVEKSFGEEPQAFLEATNRTIPFDSARKELACDIFPAQMIENIGRDPEARLGLIDKMLIGEIENLKSEIESLQIELEKNAKEIRAENQKLMKANEQLKDYGSVEDELKAHEAEQPPDLDEQEKVEFDKQNAAENTRAAEMRFMKGLTDHLSQLLERKEEIGEEISQSKNYAERREGFINISLIDPLANEADKLLNQLLSNNTASKQQLKTCISNIEKGIAQLKMLHDQQHNQFVQLKQKLEKHRTFYDKLNVLSKKVDKKNAFLQEIKEFETKRGRLKTQRDKSLNKLDALKKETLDKRLQKVTELNEMFGGKIRITLTPGGIVTEYEDALRNALKGHNMRYNTIVPYIVNNFTPDHLAKIIHAHDADKLREVSGIDIERSQAVLDALYETDAIYEIETIYCPDLPDFHLKIDKEDTVTSTAKENYKRSDELSTGQRCTTVLPVVFAISRNPLMIDQPEDNLDNKYISDTIREIVKKQKVDRQLIFITHNANIPVLSEAETNVFLKFSDKKARIDVAGNVDEVKENIVRLLEGGKDAFDRRRAVYGY